MQPVDSIDFRTVPSRQKNNFSKQLFTILGWIVILGISLYFYVESIAPYLDGSLGPRKESEKWWLIAHFAGATCTLVLGPLQFWPYLRNRYRRWHRLAGKFYIAGSIISALMVFYLLTNYPLTGSIPSLGLLAVIWLFTTIAAYYFAVKKKFILHRDFMIRSYVCGFAFVFIRLLPIINSYTGIFNFIEDEEMQGTVYEWICWVYPLMVTEFILVWWPAVRKSSSSR